MFLVAVRGVLTNAGGGLHGEAPTASHCLQLLMHPAASTTATCVQLPSRCQEKTLSLEPSQTLPHDQAGWV